MDKSFENFVLKQFNQNSSEVFSFMYEGKKYWLKKARRTYSRKIHKLLYKITSLEILLPVNKKTKIETLDFETSKIKKFLEKGISVPKIVYQNNDFFILEDCGKMVNSFIRKRDIKKDDMYYYIDKVIEKLAFIHNKNEYHGGAQARNFIYKDGKIYVIDLEDSFDNKISLEILQFRDFLLLLLSFTKTRASFELDYLYIIDKYIELTNNSSFKIKLKKLAKKISLLIILSELKSINNFLGRDGKGFFKLFKILRDL